MKFLRHVAEPMSKSDNLLVKCAGYGLLMICGAVATRLAFATNGGLEVDAKKGSARTWWRD